MVAYIEFRRAVSWRYNPDIERQTMTSSAPQIKLEADQIEAFYHDEFVADQVRDFQSLTVQRQPVGIVADIGGGVGYFASSLSKETDMQLRVIDMDPLSIEACREKGLLAVLGDALDPEIQGDEEIVCFNLILHHLVGRDETSTRALQCRALDAWRGKCHQIFVNEYIYQSFVDHVSGRLIYAITSSRILSMVGRIVSKIIPAFNANTFGVGVRFRSHEEWERLFAGLGYAVVGRRKGEAEKIALPLRLLLIKTIRRDSFLLEASA